jgi:transcriptional regulator with XRE-family HTH domain
MLGRELREARRSLGLRQVDVATAAGVSASWISRLERGLASDTRLLTLAVVLAVVGLDLGLRAYAVGYPLRDDGHRRLLARFRALLPPNAPWRTEVPLPIVGDLRAWDAMTRLWRCVVGVEAETRPTDLQALERRILLKARDGGVDRVILVLADSRANRELMRTAGESLRASFPLQGQAALDAIRSGIDPGCNLLVLV